MARSQSTKADLFTAVLKIYKSFSEAGTLPPPAIEIDATFDWPAYTHSFLANLPAEVHDSSGIADIPFRLWAATQLSGAAIRYLIATLPPKVLWPHLDTEEHRQTVRTATAGFQTNAKALSQPVVRKRLEYWLETEPSQRYPLLQLWAELPEASRQANPATRQCDLAWQGPPADFIASVLAPPEAAPPPFQPAPKPAAARPSSPPHPVSGSTRTTEKQLSALEAQLKLRETELTQLRAREAQTIAAWQHKLATQETALRTELEKQVQESDRLSRKLRAAELERDELQTENKRLKKQLRHTQELLESLKKSPLPSPPPPPVSPAPPPPCSPAPAGPLDEVFEWTADSRPVRLTARAVRRLVDQNDEEAVFTVMQSLDALQQSDPSLRAKFLNRLGEAAPYYPRVLTHSTTRVLVDASNLARQVPNRNGKGQLKFLLEAREELRSRDCFPIIFIADASLLHHINEPVKFRAMAQNGEIILADKGVEADELLTREARRTGAFVVTNDARFFHKVSPDFEPPRVGFRILDGTVIIDPF